MAASPNEIPISHPRRLQVVTSENPHLQKMVLTCVDLECLEFAGLRVKCHLETMRSWKGWIPVPQGISTYLRTGE